MTKASVWEVLLVLLGEPETPSVAGAVLPVMTIGCPGAVDVVVGMMVRTSSWELLGKALTKV